MIDFLPSTPLFWGAFLIVIGLAFIIKALFGITIPIFRIAFGALLVYGGICLIIKPFTRSYTAGHTILFQTQHMKATKDIDSYNTVFGQSTIDLSSYTPKKPVTVTINTIFGRTTLLTNPRVPTTIISNAAFSQASFPNGDTVTFGERTYTTNQEQPLITIRAHVVFGALSVE